MEARINYMRKAIQITSDKCISAAKYVHSQYWY